MSGDSRNGEFLIRARSMQVSIISDLGLEEAGVDGGGLFKEWIDVTTKRAFDPELGFFSVTPQHQLYPNPSWARLSDSTDFVRSAVVLRAWVSCRVLVKVPVANVCIHWGYLAVRWMIWLSA